MALTEEDRARFKRHLLLPEVGGQGQQALKAAKILVVGAGGLGCPILTYLATSGVGTIGIVDGDSVEVDNLHRQPLFGPSDVGRLKVEAARNALGRLVPNAELSLHRGFFGQQINPDTVAGYDLVIDGTDRFAARYDINRASHTYKVPLLSAAVGRFSGQVALFRPDLPQSPCYQCLVPAAEDNDATCETEGILGAIPGLTGTLAATEALKFLCQMEGALQNEALILDAMAGRMRRVRISKDPTCATCGV